jgi:hypothetical protein
LHTKLTIDSWETDSVPLLEELDGSLEDLDLDGNGVILKAHPWRRIGRRKFVAKLECLFVELNVPEQTVSAVASIGENFGSVRIQTLQELYSRPAGPPFFEFIYSNIDPYADGIVSQPFYNLSWVFSLGAYYDIERDPNLDLQAPRTHADAVSILKYINQQEALGCGRWRFPTITEFRRFLPKYEAEKWLPKPENDSARFWSSDELGDGEKVWTYSPYTSIGEDLCMVEDKRHLVLVADKAHW